MDHTANWLLRLGIATVAGIVVVGAVIVCLIVRGDRSWQLLATSAGQHQLTTLADGTRVRLNGSTHLKYRMKDDLRELWLLRGEARFDVAHDENRPLEVRANRTVVRAVGTAFSVRAHEDNTTTVTVEEGVVLVRDEPSTLLPDFFTKPRVTPPGTVALRHHQVAVVDGKQVAVRMLSDAELKARNAWPAERLVIDGMPLSDVLAEFARYNEHRTVILPDPQLGQYKIAGAFATDDLDSFLSVLEFTARVRVRRRMGPNGEVIEIQR